MFCAAHSFAHFRDFDFPDFVYKTMARGVETSSLVSE